jgi:hypothetical protein
MAVAASKGVRKVLKRVVISLSRVMAIDVSDRASEGARYDSGRAPCRRFRGFRTFHQFWMTNHARKPSQSVFGRYNVGPERRRRRCRQWGSRVVRRSGTERVSFDRARHRGIGKSSLVLPPFCKSFPAGFRSVPSQLDPTQTQLQAKRITDSGKVTALTFLTLSSFIQFYPDLGYSECPSKSHTSSAANFVSPDQFVF